MVVSVLLHVRDPHQPGSFGFCPWLVLSGTYCPGCGGLRAVNDLTHGDLAAAASSNLLFVGSLPLLAWVWVRWCRDRWHDRTRHHSERRALRTGALALGVALVFAVFRNTTAGAWLAP